MARERERGRERERERARREGEKEIIKRSKLSFVCSQTLSLYNSVL